MKLCLVVFLWLSAGAACLPACGMDWSIAPFTTPHNVHEKDFRPQAVPGYWSLPAAGYAVYRVRFDCNTQGLSLMLSEVSAAAEAYAQGSLLSASGIPSQNAAGEKPRLAPWIIDLNGEPELLLYVSNHNARSGGILGARVGLRSDFELERKRILLLEAGLAGFLTASGLFFLLFYTVQKQPAYLPFSVLMFVCTVRSVSSNSMLEELFVNTSWTQLRLLLEYQTAVAWMPPLFFLVVYFLFTEAGDEGPVAELRGKLSRFTAWIYAPLGLLLSLFFAASFDASFYGQFQPAYVLFYLLPGLALCGILLLSFVFEKRRGSLLLLLGFLCVLAATLADAESTVRGRAAVLFVPAGLCVFSITFMIVAGMRLREDQRALARSRSELDRAHLESHRSEEQRRQRFDEFRKEALLKVISAIAIAEEAARPADRRLLARLYSARRRLEQAGKSAGKVLDLTGFLNDGRDRQPAMIFAREDALIEIMKQLAGPAEKACLIDSNSAFVRLCTEVETHMIEGLTKLAARAGARLIADGGRIELLFAPAFGESLPLEERHRLFLAE